ncbi:hypothetical protein F8M41_001369 [Gigaspora margarita]|uniref:Uncharacterized protein n=1 Tax=Gigaspora margarita TaxID=4874 RepID=A0A8H4A948_GIGMA|nr:hypothetical protein F8M41_001369 [Gigaspora margarita]
MIECSDNFKKRQADLLFFLSNDNNDNLMERFKTALTLFPNETDMVECNDNFKESTFSQNYYMGPSHEGIDIRTLKLYGRRGSRKYRQRTFSRKFRIRKYCSY